MRSLAASYPPPVALTPPLATRPSWLKASLKSPKLAACCWQIFPHGDQIRRRRQRLQHSLPPRAFLYIHIADIQGARTQRPQARLPQSCDWTAGVVQGFCLSFFGKVTHACHAHAVSATLNVPTLGPTTCDTCDSCARTRTTGYPKAQVSVLHGKTCYRQQE